MSRIALLGICAGLLLLVASSATAGSAKVDICHIPPGNPANFHTITIGQGALSAHEAHGDIIAGPCNAFCSELCDDGNPCTVDDTGDCEGGCPLPTPVDCDDGDPCTVDSCDSAAGCINTPSPDCDCPCFDAADLALLTPVSMCNATNTAFDNRGKCSDTRNGGVAESNTSTDTCLYILQEDTGSGCVTTVNILEPMSPEQATICSGLIAAVCP